MSTNIEALIPENIRDLPVYQAGKPIEELERELGISGAIKCASNENPLGPSPLAVEAATRALANAHAYPDFSAHYLSQTLAERLGVTPDQLSIGPGSNELIYLILLALCRPGIDEVLTHKYAFISYKLAPKALNLPFVEVETTKDLACDVDALIAAMSPRTKVVLLANPNNPTGTHVRTAGLERIIEALPPQAVLVVDEAYHEYAVAAGKAVDYPQSQHYQSADQPRIITLRTFSKIYGLSGLRIGYAVGDARLIDYINRVRPAFNVNSIAQAAALAALEDEAHVRRSLDTTATGIAAIAEAARRLGLRAYPSLGNFLLVGLGRDAGPVYETLLRQGVIVRPLAAWGLPQHIRISVGTPEQTERITAALAHVVK